MRNVRPAVGIRRRRRVILAARRGRGGRGEQVAEDRQRTPAALLRGVGQGLDPRPGRGRSRGRGSRCGGRRRWDGRRRWGGCRDRRGRWSRRRRSRCRLRHRVRRGGGQPTVDPGLRDRPWDLRNVRAEPVGRRHAGARRHRSVPRRRHAARARILAPARADVWADPLWRGVRDPVAGRRRTATGRTGRFRPGWRWRGGRRGRHRLGGRFRHWDGGRGGDHRGVFLRGGAGLRRRVEERGPTPRRRPEPWRTAGSAARQRWRRQEGIGWTWAGAGSVRRRLRAGRRGRCGPGHRWRGPRPRGGGRGPAGWPGWLRRRGEWAHRIGRGLGAVGRRTATGRAEPSVGRAAEGPGWRWRPGRGRRERGVRGAHRRPGAYRVCRRRVGRPGGGRWRRSIREGAVRSRSVRRGSGLGLVAWLVLGRHRASCTSAYAPTEASQLRSSSPYRSVASEPNRGEGRRGATLPGFWSGGAATVQPLRSKPAAPLPDR